MTQPTFSVPQRTDWRRQNARQLLTNLPRRAVNPHARNLSTAILRSIDQALSTGPGAAAAGVAEQLSAISIGQISAVRPQRVRRANGAGEEDRR
jgi:hypothetical protein